MASTPVTLRVASGSLAEVGRVYAFQPGRSRVVVRLNTPDGPEIDSLSLDELEALTPDRRFVDVESVVRRMAKEILPN